MNRVPHSPKSALRSIGTAILFLVSGLGSKIACGTPHLRTELCMGGTHGGHVSTTTDFAELSPQSAPAGAGATRPVAASNTVPSEHLATVACQRSVRAEHLAAITA